MKIAVIGDFHVPSRSSKVPKFIYRGLEEQEPEKILCTGDIGKKKILRKLKEIAETEVVQGNMDRQNFPESVEEKAGELKIRMVHGSQIVPRGNKDQLKYKAQQENVDIIISGHTHVLNVEKEDEILMLNPGSATGAWSGGGANPEPSFLTLDIEDKRIKVKKIYRDRSEEEKYELN